MQTERRADSRRGINLRLPEETNPIFLLPYEVRRNLVLPEKENYDRIPALATTFRIDRQTINRLRAKMGGQYVDDLEHVIVDERCRLWGTALKWASQIGLTSFFTSGGLFGLTSYFNIGGLSPDIVIPLYLSQAIGNHKEIEDRRRTYIRVYQAAMPVIQDFFQSFQPDMFDKTPEQKVIFLPEVVDAIAKGESLERPQITALAYGALNSLAILISGQASPQNIYLAGGLSAGELVIVGKQAVELGVVGDLTRRLQKFRNNVVEASKADGRMGTNLLGELFNFVGNSDLVNRYMQGENYRGLLRVARDAGIPIAALKQQITGLIANTLREMASQLLSVDNNRASLSSAQVGISKLKEALDIVERKRTSLLTKESLTAHCRDYCLRPYATDWEAERQIIFNPGAIADIAPFDLKYEDENEQILRLTQRWVIKPGLYYANAPFGGGESAFLHGLMHRHNIQEEKESFFRVRDEELGLLIPQIPTKEFNSKNTLSPIDDVSEFMQKRRYYRLHDLDSGQIQNLFQYIHPEPEKNNLSPAALYVQDIKDLVPTEVVGNDEITAILERYHSGTLHPNERLAVATCLQVAVGLTTREEALKALMSKDIKLIISKLLPIFTREQQKNSVIEKLFYYKININGKPSFLFDDKDLEAINKFSSQSMLTKSTRAKLRIIRTLEKAEKLGSRIVGIDQTLDGLSDEDKKVFLAYLSDWSMKNGTAIIITTHNEPIKKYIKDSGAYRETIYFARVDDRTRVVGFTDEIEKEKERQRRIEFEQERIRLKKEKKAREQFRAAVEKRVRQEMSKRTGTGSKKHRTRAENGMEK